MGVPTFQSKASILGIPDFRRAPDGWMIVPTLSARLEVAWDDKFCSLSKKGEDLRLHISRHELYTV